MKNLVKKLQVYMQSGAACRGRKRRRAQRGMTLVEIMVVVVIMSLVAGVVGVAMFNTLGSAKANVAKTQIAQLSDALDLYRLQHHKYPSNLQALTQSQGSSKPVMDMIPKDPWQKDYIYTYPGTRNQGKFDLMSNGEDEIAGTADDIGNWVTQAQ